MVHVDIRVFIPAVPLGLLVRSGEGPASCWSFFSCSGSCIRVAQGSYIVLPVRNSPFYSGGLSNFVGIKQAVVVYISAALMHGSHVLEHANLLSASRAISPYTVTLANLVC